jgi:hypothetical protein
MHSASGYNINYRVNRTTQIAVLIGNFTRFQGGRGAESINNL